MHYLTKFKRSSNHFTQEVSLIDKARSHWRASGFPECLQPGI